MSVNTSHKLTNTAAENIASWIDSDRENASSMVTAGATANTTEGNSRASRESGSLCSHSHGESIDRSNPSNVEIFPPSSVGTLANVTASHTYLSSVMRIYYYIVGLVCTACLRR